MKLTLFFFAVVSLLFCLDVAESLSRDAKDSLYNVADFGAVGDGVHDDSNSIQAAINSASEAGGGSVLLPWPKAKYRLAKSVTVKSHIILKGGGDKVPVFLDNAFVTTAGNRDIVIENLSLEGKDRANPCIHTSSSSPTDADDIIRNNHFKGCKFGIYSANWIRNVIIENNFFTDCVYGLYLHTIDNWKIVNNRFNHPMHRPIEIHNGHHNVVSGNYIEGKRPETIIGILFMTNATLMTDGPSDNIVTNNVVRHIGEEGIMLEETVANAFKTGGNVSRATTRSLTHDGAQWKQDAFAGRDIILVDGTGAGQWRKVISNTQDTLVTDRDWTVTPDRSTKFTVVKAIKGNIISRNIVEDTGRMGIEFYGPSLNNIIDGNVVRWGGTNKDYSGIAITGTSGQGGNTGARHPAIGNIVVNNSIHGSAHAGIQLYQVNYAPPDFFNLNNTISGNEISDATVGIEVFRSRHTLVTGNLIFSVTDGIREGSLSDFNVIGSNLIHDFKAADIVLSGPKSQRINN